MSIAGEFGRLILTAAIESERILLSSAKGRKQYFAQVRVIQDCSSED